MLHAPAPGDGTDWAEAERGQQLAELLKRAAKGVAKGRAKGMATSKLRKGVTGKARR